jgi:phosphopantothenoylcysteine synthetase/decarboxylase
MRFLVTAGNTQEMIDRVRQWSNIFTGTTGLSIARALTELGEVELLTSNKVHLAELARENRSSLKVGGFGSHEDLRDALERRMRAGAYDAVFMSAAVADYRPAGVFSIVSRTPTDVPGQEQWIVQDVQAGKVKSNHPAIAVKGEQTQKLVDLFRREWNHRGILVKFKLEVGISPEELIRIGQASRLGSGAEYLVANTLEMVEGPRAGAYLLSDGGSEWVPRDTLPGRMVRLVREHTT